MKFNVIVSDPPWSFEDELKAMGDNVRRSAQSQYSTLSLSEIKKLPVHDIADPRGCLLALWVPGSMLSDGLETMNAWGFKHKQIFVWVKTKKDALKESDMNKMTRIGMGRLFRQAHEIALIGTSGKSVYNFLEDKSQRSVAFDLNVKHSKKPETLQNRLDTMFPNVPKLEMFARRQRRDWLTVGNEIDGKDIRDVLVELSQEGEQDNDRT